jgi:molecular chaperone GrpE
LLITGKKMTKPAEPLNDNNEHEVQPQAEQTTETDRIAELETQVAQLKDQWVRAAAETENVRKRAERDQQETAKYAAAKFARDMVDVLENVKRAAESLTPEKRAENELLKTVGDGMDMTVQELTGIFARHGVQRIDPMGAKFDHNIHQAVVQVDMPDSEPGTVVQVVQAGYMHHDRLLRPAMVAVTKAADSAKKVDTNA